MSTERLVLTEQQSAHIRSSGQRFLIVHPGSYPETGARYVIDMIPCTYEQARAAVEVAQGKSKAVRFPAARNPKKP